MERDYFKGRSKPGPPPSLKRRDTPEQIRFWNHVEAVSAKVEERHPYSATNLAKERAREETRDADTARPAPAETEMNEEENDETTVDEPTAEPTPEVDPLDALDDLDFEIPEEQEVEDNHPDEFDSAVNFAFVGVGQAGGRFAETAYQLGFRKVLAINSATGDLAKLTALPKANRLVVGTGEGAGKSPDRGLDLMHNDRDKIYDALHTCLGHDVEQVFVCLGAGGGTGSGGATRSEGKDNVFDTVRRYLDTLEGDASGPVRVGAIVSIPQTIERATVLRNAHRVLGDVFDEVDAGNITPMVTVDNGRVRKLWPDVDALTKWSKPNLTIIAMLKSINILASTDADDAFDAQDFRSILASGTMMFGAVDVRDMSSTSLSEAFRKNVERTMLAEGFDLRTATCAAALTVGPSSMLSQVKATDLEYAANQLGDMLEIRGSDMLHRGIYPKDSFKAVRIYTVIGGLARPSERLAEIEAKSV